jgi:hypothetical protein
LCKIINNRRFLWIRDARRRNEEAEHCGIRSSSTRSRRISRAVRGRVRIRCSRRISRRISRAVRG